MRLLETPNSTEKQKLAVVETLQTICTNPQTLVDIFLNYDCDLESKDIFEKMVLDLSTVAKGVERRRRFSLLNAFCKDRLVLFVSWRSSLAFQS